MTSLLTAPKRLLVGNPLRNERMGETLLPKRIALPVFCSDPLSSNAYATEEILLVLSVGGASLLHLTPFIALGVIVLLVVVVASYRQTCYAYPTGGGAYAVSRANLGARPALVAASALMVDYVLTVAVSVAAGVANIVSAFPWLAHSALPITLGFVALLAVIIGFHWIERDSLKDNYDGQISFADILYFTMISATTTGYGDIVPITERARLFDALVVTPIRVIFLLLLAGTAYTFFIKRLWDKWLMRRLQRGLSEHIIVAGFGVSGSAASSTDWPQESMSPGSVGGRTGGRCHRSKDTSCRRTSSMPEPRCATTGATGMPRPVDNVPTSIRPPRAVNSSPMVNASRHGMSSPSTWPINRIERRSVVASATSTTASGGSIPAYVPASRSVTTCSSGLIGSRL